MKKVKLKMSMFRTIKESNYPTIYQSDYATFVYTVLRHLCKSDSELIITPYQIYRTFSTNEPNSSAIKGIKEGITILHNNKMLSYIKKGSNYTINPYGLEIKTKQEVYFDIPIEYIKKVIAQTSGVKLLHHYLLLTSTINVKTHTGMHDRHYFGNALNLEVRTISRHHKKFVELEIICFSSKKSCMNKKGEFINLPKLYCMPEYTHLLDKVQDEQLSKGLKKSEIVEEKIVTTFSAPIFKKNPFI